MKRIFLVGVFIIIGMSMVASAATISGVVSDSAGSPLKSIAIALKPATATGTAIARDTTDSTGAFSVTCDSTSGKYAVKTTDAKGVYITQYDTVVLDGTNKTVTIKMAKINKVTVSGTITDSAAGTALSGAVVKLTVGMTTKTDTTKTDGNYSFDSVTTGATIAVTAAGFISKTVTPAIGATAVTLDVALGKVKMVSVSGTVTDSAAGTPLAGAVVKLTVGTTTKRDTTKADGKYTFDSVKTGATISASATGYVTKTLTPTIGDAALTADIALATIKYGSVSGTVTDSATGTAIAGAVVKFGMTKNDTTKADGKFTFDSLTTGQGTVSVTVHGYASRTSTVTIVGDSVRTVDFNLIAVPYGSVAGTVTDSAGGTAIAGAIVTLQAKNGLTTMTDTSGADGTFLITDVGLATYTITASAARHLMATDSVVVSDTARKTVSLKLSAFVYFAVSGTVTDSATGKPVVGALVALRTGNTAVIASTIDSVLTDSSGHYAFDSAFGEGRIRVTAANYTLSRTDLTATTSAAQTINIKIVNAPVMSVRNMNGVKLQPTITVAGDCLILNNMSDAVSVRLMNLKGELVGFQSFSAGGRMSLKLGRHLTTGTYIVKIIRKSGVLSEKILVK